MRRAHLALLLLTLAAAAYTGAALLTPPGFFEGFCPPIDYRFVSPPPGVIANHQPASGHGEIKVAGGVVSPGYVATADPDPQAQLSFVPGAFAPPADGSPKVTIDLKPAREFPKPLGLTLVTNVYQVSASSPLIKNANLRLLYSTVLPAPSAIYSSRDGEPWQAVASNSSAGASGCTEIVAQISSTGYYAAGFASTRPASSATTSTRIGGGQTLPVIVALAILIVVLAGVPLAVVRRRRPTGPPEAAGEDPSNPGPSRPDRGGRT